jgi:hypothetical protein
VDLVSCPNSCQGAGERLPWYVETNRTLSVDIVRLQSNVNGVPNSAVHVAGSHGDNGGIQVTRGTNAIDSPCSEAADSSTLSSFAI